MNEYLFKRLSLLHWSGMSLDDRVALLRKSYKCDVVSVSEFFFKMAEGYFPEKGPGYITCAQRLAAENHINKRYVFIRRASGQGFHVVERVWDEPERRVPQIERRKTLQTETRI